MTVSVFESIDDVGSSRIRIGASFKNARATQIRWRSPTDSCAPPSPSTVLYPFGSFSMKSCAFADLAASTISGIVASSRPYRMLSTIGPEKSSGVCSTTLTCSRSDFTFSLRTSIPSTRTAPDCGSWNRLIKLMSVVLPAPVGPTIATRLAGSTANVMSLSVAVRPV